MMRMFCRMMHQGALDPIQSSVWQTSYPGSDSVTHGASTALWGESICLSSGEICPVANTVLGIARKARIKPGPLHASLVLATNKIIHFYQVCALSLAISCSSIRQRQDERKERWEEMRREREGEGEIPLYKCRVQSFQVWTFFPGTDCCPVRVI